MPVEASVDFMQEAFGQVASEPFVAKGYLIFVGPPGEVAGDGEPLGTQDIVEAIGAAARGVGALLQVQLPSLLHTTVRTALWFGERC